MLDDRVENIQLLKRQNLSASATVTKEEVIAFGVNAV